MISISGSDTKLEYLSRVAAASGGAVDLVEAESIKFTAAKRDVIAHDCLVRIIPVQSVKTMAYDMSDLQTDPNGRTEGCEICRNRLPTGGSRVEERQREHHNRKHRVAQVLRLFKIHRESCISTPVAIEVYTIEWSQ